MSVMNIKDLAYKYESVKQRLDRHSSLRITDGREVIADGCRRVVSCDENAVIFMQTSHRVVVMGVGLRLRNWGVDGVVVSGEITSVELERR